MIDKLSLQITERICTEEYDNPKDRARIQYAIAVLFSEGFKVLVLFSILKILHHENFFFLSLAIVMTVRTFSGGLHMTNTLTCLFLTIPIFLFTCFLAPSLLELHREFYAAVSILSVVIVFLRAPRPNPEKHIDTIEKRMQFKKISMFFTIFWCTIGFLLKDSAYINCVFFTLLIQNLQLLPKGRSNQ